jgi:hypothetical protein
MIFGTGFAPFRGGPLFYLDQLEKVAEPLGVEKEQKDG